MAQKLLIFVLAACLSSGLALPFAAESKELESFDHGDSFNTANYGPNHVFEYGILYRPGETHVSCNVVMPDGNNYNLWPNFNVPVPTIGGFGNGACGIRFNKPSSFFDGTYKLQSLVTRSDGSPFLYTINYHLTFIPRQDVKAITDDESINVVRVMA